MKHTALLLTTAFSALLLASCAPANLIAESGYTSSFSERKHGGT